HRRWSGLLRRAWKATRRDSWSQIGHIGHISRTGCVLLEVLAKLHRPRPVAVRLVAGVAGRVQGLFLQERLKRPWESVVIAERVLLCLRKTWARRFSEPNPEDVVVREAQLSLQHPERR